MNSEEKIKEVAKRIFMKEGIEGTTIRDIARQAGVNAAMVNYYFRSKKNLYHIVLSETIASFNPELRRIAESDKDIELKIEEFVNKYTDILLENPKLPVFIINEVIDGNKSHIFSLPGHSFFTSEKIAYQIKQKIKEVSGDDTDQVSIFMDLIGLAVSPFIVKDIIMDVFCLEEEDFREIILKRKKQLVKMLLYHFRLENNYKLKGQS